MSLSTSTNIVVEGNTFDFGAGTADQTSSVAYGYYACVSLGADAIVTNNFFSGVSGASYSLVNITDGYSTFMNNRFMRGTNTIQAYITATGTTDQKITHNYFDQSTVDGTSTVLVNGITNTSTYTQNKNQTEYVYLTLDQYIPQLNSSANLNEYAWTATSPLSHNPCNLNFDSGNWQSLVLFTDTVNAAATGNSVNSRDFRMKVCVSNFIPDGARILDVKQGLWMSHLVGTVDSASGFYLDITRTKTGAALLDAKSVAGGPSNELDTSNIYNQIEAKYPPTGFLSGANLTNLQSSTQYIHLNIQSFLTFGDLSQYFVTNKQQPIFISWAMFLNLDNDGSSTNIFFSPIQITYIW